MLKPSEVSKKLLAKPRKTRSQSEWFDYSGKYRDEHVAKYNEKKEKFLAAAEEYNRLNVETLNTRKIRLHAHYQEMLNTDFLKEKEPRDEEECDPLCCCPKCSPNTTGRLERKRNLRQMNYVRDPRPGTCLIEPWFRKYLTLNKFIKAARTVIIRNRLLKVLKTLKALTPEKIQMIENSGVEKRAEDFHCHPVFLKFL